jgi:hypothetical protein
MLLCSFSLLEAASYAHGATRSWIKATLVTL